MKPASARKAPKHLTPKEKSRIIQLRVEGHSLRAIARLTDRSLQAVQDVLKANPVDLSAITQEALQAAGESFNRYVSPDWLASVASRQAIKLLDQADNLQGRVEQAMMEPNPDRYSVLSRANAAQSATLTNLTKIYTSLLPMQTPEQEQTDLPELKIHVMDSSDVAAMRQQQEQEAAMMGGNQ